MHVAVVRDVDRSGIDVAKQWVDAPQDLRLHALARHVWSPPRAPREFLLVAVAMSGDASGATQDRNRSTTPVWNRQPGGDSYALTMMRNRLGHGIAVVVEA